ncbi:MAG: hypothetical protein GY862_22745 [Gammaproteobacteria bacterium]|nr:hypothetical protein [Gammaproteobacteria bacterium]
MNPNSVAATTRNAPEWSVREAAVRELTDQKTLAAVAQNDSYSVVRSAAVSELTDQKLLAAIARKGASVHGGTAIDQKLLAVEKLTSQKLLMLVAENAVHWSVREAAVKKLNKQ